MHEDAADLISNLPDPVLLLILSGLRSTKELIRTSILSRRWRYLWSSFPSLDFKYQGRRNRSEKSKFKNIVYWALLQRSVDLDSFRLSCSYDFSRSTLERWIHASVMRNVKQLDFSFRAKERPDDMVMPHCLVTCASLEVFKLHLGSRLIVPSFSGFPSLRVLMLENVEMFNDGIVKYFLESCPLLEDLTLDDCNIDKLDLLCISSPKLKKLSFWYPENDDFTGCLKVSCPKLVFLGITGLSASDYIFEGHSLKEAVIDDDCEKISKLLHKISYLESLRTNLCFLYYECIGDAPDLGLPNLKNLELTTINGSYTVRGLKQILKICPKLEFLCLTFENSCIYEDDIEYYDETEYLNLDGVGTWNLTPDVAWVEFFEFNGEMPKLFIFWSDKNRSEWMYVVAKWGNGATFFH